MTINNQDTTHNIKIENPPLISIITVVYNGAETIEQTIQSVIEQPYQNKEYIIIDGGSNDGTVDLIKKYESYLSYWVSEPDNGIFDAMNKGIGQAKGELIGIINANDWYEKNIFTKIAEQYLKTGSNQIIHGLIRNFLDEEFYSMVGNSIRILRYNMIQHPTCFIPRMLYQTYGKYNQAYKFTADYDLILRFVNKGVEFSFIEIPIVNFRLGGISSIPAAEKEMYKIRVKHHLISRTEYILRIILAQTGSYAKRFLS